MIDLKETKRIAELAHIDFDEAGLQKISVELSKILEYIDQLQAIKLPEAPPLPAEGTPMRADTPAPSVSIDQIENNAPAFRDGFFVVPKVIGGEP